MRHNAGSLINVLIIVCADDDRQSPRCCRHGRTDRRNSEIDDSTYGEQYNVICIFFTFYFTKATNYFLSLAINYESNNYTTVEY